MRGVEADDTRPTVDGLGSEVDQLVAGLKRLGPEIGPLAEELIRLLRSDEITPGIGIPGGNKD